MPSTPETSPDEELKIIDHTDAPDTNATAPGDKSEEQDEEQDTEEAVREAIEAASEPLVVILNPASGSVKNAGDDDESFRSRIEKALQSRNADFEIRETTLEVGADEMARTAAQEGTRRLLVCGGDGTVMAALNGLYAGQDDQDDERPVLSIIPGGTANLLATALEIPIDVEEAVEVALTGVTRSIDLGRCGKHVFALGLGLGLTEKLISKTSAQEKETLGKLAYAKAMLREIGAHPTRFRFQLDDEPEQTSRGVGIVIANAGRIGGALQFAPEALMDDGKLDLCILHRFEVRDVLRMLGKMLVGNLPEDRAVTFLQGKSIKILSEPPLDLQIDGEEVEESTPLEAQVLPGVLQVRVSAVSDIKMEEEKIEKTAPHLAPPKRKKWPLAVGAGVVAAGALTLWKKRSR